MKRMIALFCMMALVLTGCGGGTSGDSEATSTPSAGKAYREETYVSLPDENLLYEDDTLNVTDLQTNLQGEPALYQYVTDTDENDESFAAIYEYTLNADGNWQTKECVRKALTKTVMDIVEKEMKDVDIPFITRGDDGNLYALLKVTEPGIQNPMAKKEERLPCQYFALVIDESGNALQKVKLQTKVDVEGTEVDYATEYDVTQFHVTEDGTYFLVFSGSGAMWFDSASGTQTNVCESIADSAFGKKVGFGESEVVYYSTAKKKFGVLDSDTLTLSSEFGDDIPEEYRKYEWYFDTDTTNWQMYAFNLSGLYRFSDFGKKTSATRLSANGSFDSLADANIYDILVGANQELYLLVRKSPEGETGEQSWEFGVLKYTAK